MPSKDSPTAQQYTYFFRLNVSWLQVWVYVYLTVNPTLCNSACSQAIPYRSVILSCTHLGLAAGMCTGRRCGPILPAVGSLLLIWTSWDGQGSSKIDAEWQHRIGTAPSTPLCCPTAIQISSRNWSWQSGWVVLPHSAHLHLGVSALLNVQWYL